MNLIRVIPIYRAYLREIRQLPHVYLRQFFRIKMKDDTYSLLKSSDLARRQRKMKRMVKDLRKLQAAVNGDVKSFEHILNVAYGRKGKLKWELIEPLLSDLHSPQIIPALEKSRPPTFSPILKALLMSKHSRTGKPVEAKHLAVPPTLPTRADPSSDEARLLGPFSRRREVNIHWKYYVSQYRRVYPPLKIIPDDSTRSARNEKDTGDIRITDIGLQKIFQDAEDMIGNLHNPPLSPRRQSHCKEVEEIIQLSVLRHPSRWVRRRYQGLLTRLPVVKVSGSPNREPGSCTVELSPKALRDRWSTSLTLPEASLDSLAWYEVTQKATSKT